ncbi:uncharacterized protein EV154DRAFT_605303 [Mucor mucedo]|uniref:uncharacterized protein n=1 Tax=Mucor mucedo TaxID=29922 RepID=UPI0022202249|nr:uncharacterized protein EV154DRAFT_605303 [Mucor mucedo]KAI7887866.1 hypothetical protein EV154DRAFT_605303 [Mucor mucedo]
MDLNTIPATQHYDAGFVTLSYIVSVIGSMTALELLQRRTHIRGYYNWFLLFASAVAMGGVGIWSMHFIGNNSLTIRMATGKEYYLTYAPGFTFASLFVAIGAMFLAFAFVGITEEAKVRRIIPSGTVAGFGIVSMHYLGQVAVNFFILKNIFSIMIAAIVIAVFAVNVALFVFFKLREQWENQWYKRLACAMLLGGAACGMHYTALLGTLYYPGITDSGPPKPLMGTSALIGMIAGIVITTCIVLFIIGARASIQNSTSLFQSNKSQKRLILDTVFFDTNGRILVGVDGIVPMKEILNEIPEDETHETFSTSHPLFTRLFETTIQWAKSRNSSDEVYDANLNYQSSDDIYNLADLGHLFDSVLTANTIRTRSIFSNDSKKRETRRDSSTSSVLLTNLTSKKNIFSKKKNKQPVSRPESVMSQVGDATVIDIFNNPVSNALVITRNLSVRDSDSEDRHIFLVKKIESNKDLVNLLSIGFRFAEPIFISKTMGERLKVPSDYMLNYFKDMLQMTETASVLYKPVKPLGHEYYTSPAQQREKHENDLRGGVFVGIFSLIEDDDMPYLIVNKETRYRFPMVQLNLQNGTTELSRAEKSAILSLSGQSLSSISSITATNSRNRQRRSSTTLYTDTSPNQSVGSGNTLINIKYNNDDSDFYSYGAESSTSIVKNTDVKTEQFMEALEAAAVSLIGMSSYGKPLAASAKLYGDIIDIPAFSLRPGPCQLIIFKSHITTPGTRFAINSTLTESIKCVPFPIYRSYAYHITDVAVKKYRDETNRHRTPTNCLIDQRVYQNTAGQNNNLIEENPRSSFDENNLDLQEEGSTALATIIPAPKGEVSPMEQAAQLQSLSSLPPPPRMKRTKLTYPTGIASLNNNFFTKDLVPNMIKGVNVSSLDPGNSSAESSALLNLLPATARFWWLNNMYEETRSSTD